VRILIFFCLVILISCTSKEADTSLFYKQQSLGSVSGELDEASGLVASVTNPGYLWTHNDGNNPSEIYLINDKAETVMTCRLKRAWNDDWEDITIGPGPEPGVNYLYVADIGDNGAKNRFKRLYRIKEPILAEGKHVLDDVEKILIELPDGPRDSEAIMVDPISKNFYIISKRERSVRLYEIKYPFVNDTIQAVKLGKLPFTDIVAANISPDGSEVLIKNYGEIYYWKRQGDEPIVDVLNRKPINIDYDREPQGEAIAWKLDGSGFYTLSESKIIVGGNLYFFKRK
jgi:hypothetical protein